MFILKELNAAVGGLVTRLGVSQHFMKPSYYTYMYMYPGMNIYFGMRQNNENSLEIVSS